MTMQLFSHMTTYYIGHVTTRQSAEPGLMRFSTWWRSGPPISRIASRVSLWRGIVATRTIVFFTANFIVTLIYGTHFHIAFFIGKLFNERLWREEGTMIGLRLYPALFFKTVVVFALCMTKIPYLCEVKTCFDDFRVSRIYVFKLKRM
jgi:hypothetical protein